MRGKCLAFVLNGGYYCGVNIDQVISQYNKEYALQSSFFLLVFRDGLKLTYFFFSFRKDHLITYISVCLSAIVSCVKFSFKVLKNQEQVGA